MALGIEAEILVELLKAAAEHRHFLGREGQSLAGPQPGVDANADDLALLLDRNDYEVERDAAVDARLAFGLRHQRHFAAFLEITHRAEAAALVGRRARDAEDAESFGRNFVRPLDMSELAKVGAAIGCPITESGEDRMAVTARLGAFKTSMLQDVEAGRPIELEALLGAPREIARRHGITTPALDRLYRVTKLMAEGLGLG